MTELQKKAEKTKIEEIKGEWKRLWLERIDDKVRAEGVAGRSFPLCFVDSGTVIVATRDYRPLDFKEILNQNHIQHSERVIGPPPAVGGWRKFARTVLNKQQRHYKFFFEKPQAKLTKNLQLKKGGRGWLHRSV